MPKAIRTHFVGPSNVKGSRLIADDGDGNRVIVSYSHEGSSEENHRAAALALSRKMKWNEDLIGGWYRNDMIWVEPQRYETTKWIECGHALTAGNPSSLYTLYKRRMDGVPIYAARIVSPPDDDEGGYPNLFSMLALKGLTMVKS